MWLTKVFDFGFISRDCCWETLAEKTNWTFSNTCLEKTSLRKTIWEPKPHRNHCWEFVWGNSCEWIRLCNLRCTPTSSDRKPGEKLLIFQNRFSSGNYFLRSFTWKIVWNIHLKMPLVFFCNHMWEFVRIMCKNLFFCQAFLWSHVLQKGLFLSCCWHHPFGYFFILGIHFWWHGLWAIILDQIVQTIFDNCLSRQNVLTECLQTELWKTHVTCVEKFLQQRFANCSFLSVFLYFCGLWMDMWTYHSANKTSWCKNTFMNVVYDSLKQWLNTS